jgi:hypothetical protein
MAILMALLRFSRGGGSREKGIWPKRGRRKNLQETLREFPRTKGGVNFLKIGRRRIKNDGGEGVVALKDDAWIRTYAEIINSSRVSNY